MSPPPLDVLIVGAGPIGLATAAAALQHGAQNVLVVEQARTLRPAGQAIDLLPNAYRFLCEIAPTIAPSLQPFRHKYQPGKPRLISVTPDAKTISKLDTTPRGPAASLLWWQLQKLLLNVLPEDILVLNHRLVDIVHDDDADLVYAKFAPDSHRKNQFKNWMGDDDDDVSQSDTDQVGSSSHSSDYFSPATGEPLVTCAARIIVGADGINSVARTCVYRDTCPAWEKYARAVYSGVSMFGAAAPPGIVTKSHNLSLDYVNNATLVSHTCNPDVVSFDTLRIMMGHNVDNSNYPFEWFVIYFMSVDEDTARNGSDNQTKECIIDHTRSSGFSEDIITLTKHIWEGSQAGLFRRPYSIVPATHPPPYQLHPTAVKIDYPQDFKRPWHYGRVVLVGDAVHGNPPNLGQGTAMGFEDVFVLMEALSSKDVWSDGVNSSIDKEILGQAFEEYYMQRIDRVCFLQKHVMNRMSEYDTEYFGEVREKLWTYGPSTVKDEMKARFGRS